MNRGIIINQLREFNVSKAINSISLEISRNIEETGKRGILLKIEERMESIILAGIAVRALGPQNIRCIYFIKERKRRMNKDMERLLNFLKIPFVYIEIGSLARDIVKYVTGYTSHDFYSIIRIVEALILRRRADDEDLLLLGEITRSEWLLGIFDIIYAKSMDLLPLTHLYRTQLDKIFTGLRLQSYIRHFNENPEWRIFKNSLGVKEDLIIDSILYGLTHHKTDQEIYDEIKGSNINIDISIIKRIRRLFEKVYYKRNSPLIFL